MQERLSNFPRCSIYYGVLAQRSVRHTSALPMVTLSLYFCSLYKDGELLCCCDVISQIWQVQLTLHRLLLCDKPDKVHLKAFSCLGNRSQVSPQGLPFIFISAQHPVTYNIWQLKEIRYYKEVSDVESAPRTVPKTSCEPERLSHGETEHRAHSSDEIRVKKLMKIT